MKKTMLLKDGKELGQCGVSTGFGTYDTDTMIFIGDIVLFVKKPGCGDPEHFISIVEPLSKEDENSDLIDIQDYCKCEQPKDEEVCFNDWTCEIIKRWESIIDGETFFDGKYTYKVIEV